MNKNDIWKAADDEFYKMPMEIIAKAFITKWTHVISLIRAEKGRNSYINDKNKLHSGVRVNFKSNIFKSNNYLYASQNPAMKARCPERGFCQREG